MVEQNFILIEGFVNKDPIHYKLLCNVQSYGLNQRLMLIKHLYNHGKIAMHILQCDSARWDELSIPIILHIDRPA